ncbi:MAG TPA: MBL fold metallo-hydrolase [Anaerolineae bacterium]|nr:MBL fold metallo-hydrolase [Anaerolineae bacterium]
MKLPPHLTYLGHATVLIDLDGVRLLTDPLLRQRAVHLRRRSSPIDPIGCLPVDAVLISHLHWDHLDLPSLRALGHHTRLIVPRGAARALRGWGFQRVEEIAAGETTRVGGVKVEATSAHHVGFRLPFGPRTACLGYIVRGSHQVYFAGDTDLFPGMAELGNDLDAALLPVWGWGPTLGAGHLDPWRAAEALALLRPRIAVPIHWGTFCPLGMGWARPRFLTHPPVAFAQHAAQLAPEVEVRIITPGQPTHLSL